MSICDLLIMFAHAQSGKLADLQYTPDNELPETLNQFVQVWLFGLELDHDDTKTKLATLILILTLTMTLIMTLIVT